MKTHNIKICNPITNLNSEIECGENISILDAAEKNKICLPSSCLSGQCSSCVAKILSGSILQNSQNFLDLSQLENGFALLCVSYPVSDISLLSHQENFIF